MSISWIWTAAAIPILLIATKWFFERINSSFDHKRQVSRMILQDLNTYVREYYTPIMMYALTLADSLGKLRQSDPPQREIKQSFFYLTQYLRVSYELNEKFGMVFLKDIVGEKLITQADLKIYETLTACEDKYLSRQDVSEIIQCTSRNDFLTDFITNKLPCRPFKPIFEKYSSWVQENEEQVRSLADYITYYVELFQLEVDSIYEDWYGKSPGKVKGKSLQVLKCELKRLVNEEEAKQYLNLREFREINPAVGITLDDLPVKTRWVIYL